jgi:hypothetical protein
VTAGKPARTARRSKREQVAQKRKQAEDAPPQLPLPEPGPAELPPMPPSPIAEWLLSPTPQTWARLQIAASLGRLTKADLQTALMAQMHIEVEHFNRDPENFENARKAYVNRQRLLRSLLDVVKQSVVSGPMQVIRLVWPTHYEARDPGEDVRLEVTDE